MHAKRIDGAGSDCGSGSVSQPLHAMKVRRHLKKSFGYQWKSEWQGIRGGARRGREWAQQCPGRSQPVLTLSPGSHPHGVNFRGRLGRARRCRPDRRKPGVPTTQNDGMMGASRGEECAYAADGLKRRPEKAQAEGSLKAEQQSPATPAAHPPFFSPVAPIPRQEVDPFCGAPWASKRKGDGRGEEEEERCMKEIYKQHGVFLFLRFTCIRPFLFFVRYFRFLIWLLCSARLRMCPALLRYERAPTVRRNAVGLGLGSGHRDSLRISRNWNENQLDFWLPPSPETAARVLGCNAAYPPKIPLSRQRLGPRLVARLCRNLQRRCTHGSVFVIVIIDRNAAE